MTFQIHEHDLEIPTLGVEIEYQVVDPETRGLRSDTGRLLTEGAQIHGSFIRPEFHAPVVECLTAPCNTVGEVRAQLLELRRTLIGLARKHGLAVIASSTHPITHWKDVQLTVGERYGAIEQSLGDVARSNLICGLHCHVGIENPDARIAVMNGVRHVLPIVLAMSTSSPFWQGRDTGLASVRTGIFRRFPRTGLPGIFESHAHFDRWVATLVETGCIQDAKNIYWDLRPHPHYPTLEFRICDVPPKIEETVAIVAFIQVIVTRLANLWRKNMAHRTFRRSFIDENVYRAMAQGLEAEFIDLPGTKVIPARDLILKMIDDYADEVRLLGLENEMQSLVQLLESGSSSKRQREVHAETGSLEAIVDHLIEETGEGVLPPRE